MQELLPQDGSVRSPGLSCGIDLLMQAADKDSFAGRELIL